MKILRATKRSNNHHFGQSPLCDGKRQILPAIAECCERVTAVCDISSMSQSTSKQMPVHIEVLKMEGETLTCIYSTSL